MKARPIKKRFLGIVYFKQGNAVWKYRNKKPWLYVNSRTSPTFFARDSFFTKDDSERITEEQAFSFNPRIVVEQTARGF